jgi:omega-hydroxy-beta-dihydromenaquinone-9 sulfotransferase
MHFYNRVLQRFLYSRGGKHKLLSKNPSICPKIASIYETFPTARVIYLVRNPLEMLPSTISWLGYTWRVFSDPLSPYPFTQEILQFTKHWYAYPLKVLKKTDPSKYLIIKYDDLILNPQETIRQIYAHFDYEMSPDFERQVAEIVKGSGDFRSRHQYNLENMGFSREQILTEFSDIFDQFGFDRSLDGISPTGKESTLD